MWLTWCVVQASIAGTLLSNFPYDDPVLRFDFANDTRLLYIVSLHSASPQPYPATKEL